MMEIKGKTALVTGGASGIGLACVRKLLQEGAQVAVCDLNEIQGEKLLTELQAEFGKNKVIFLKTDVTDAEQLESAFKKTISTFKCLDMVFNNAGIHSAENWELVIDVNLVAVARGMSLAHKYMGKHNGGRGGFVCNTASILGLMSCASAPVYSATKHAIVGITRAYGMSFHLNRTGVRVAAICPGLTESALLTTTPRRVSEDEELMDCMQKELAMYPSQKAEAVAAAMMVLVKSASSGTIWVAEGSKPVYEVKIPPYQECRAE